MLAFALLALLPACAPLLAPVGTVTQPPAILGNHYLTRDGAVLGLTRWEAENPTAIVVALHGMGDYSNAFAEPAAWWARHGITTYAYDQRGFGRSPYTGLWAGSDVLRRDLADFVAVIRARHPATPVFVLGESMGGAVAMTAFASPEPPGADGLILVAPAVWSRETMPASYRIALWLGAHTIRWRTFTGQGLGIRPSDNIEMLRAMARDPLIIKGTRADAIYGLVNLMDDAHRSAPALTAKPVLLLYGDKDQVIPAGPMKDVIGRLGSNATVKTYATGYHLLLRDLEAQARWQDIADWIRKNAPARAPVLSGAANAPAVFVTTAHRLIQ